MSRTLILFPPTTKHLGLLNDLAERKDVVLFEVGYKDTNAVGKIARKIHLSRKVNSVISLPNRKRWFTPIEQLLSDGSINKILIIDGALNYIDKKDLLSIKQIRKELKIYLFMINAIAADSPSVNGVKDFIFGFPWDEMFTFDPEDARKYNMTYKGFCYYSVHSLPNYQGELSDIYFIGGLKGGREKTIIDTFQLLSNEHVKCDYRLMVYGKTTPVSKPGLTYLPLGWRPYEEVLSAINHTKCILEILQNGQSGASLRYFEAVCYNKKLLTNNSHIKDFPYYNPQYMRVFDDIHDIDIEWIKADEFVEYGYQGDFSPNVFINMLNSTPCSNEKNM